MVSYPTGASLIQACCLFQENPISLSSRTTRYSSALLLKTLFVYLTVSCSLANASCNASTLTTPIISENGFIAPTNITTEKQFVVPDYIHKWSIKCVLKSCVVSYNSTYQNVVRGLEWVEAIFMKYVKPGATQLDMHDLQSLMRDIGVSKVGEIKEKDSDSLEETDNDRGENEQGDNNHSDDFDNGIDDRSFSDSDEQSGTSDDFDYSSGLLNDMSKGKNLCLKSANSIFDKYYPQIAYKQIKIELSDFYLILPRLLFHLSSSACVGTNNRIPLDVDGNGHDNDGHEEGDIMGEKESTLKVWGIALISVVIISMLSVIGIMIVPLMGRSTYFQRLLSFLVALAVGTLIGDALLHLLPHAMGGHEEGHSHSGGAEEEEEEEEKDKILKSLVAVMGCYFFFVFESSMSMVRKLRQKRRHRSSIDCTPKLVIHSPNKSDEFLTDKTDTDDPLLNTSNGSPSSNRSDDVIIKSTDSGISSTNTGFKFPSQSSYSSLKPAENDYPSNKTQQFSIDLNISNTEESGSKYSVTKSEEAALDNEHGHHHHHGDIANAQGIKDLAWMIIAGDGLHNFSDGLAIGAAFTSSISAGLSTSLAIFCHELPHELGDFAILIDAGMSIKKALLYNALCACLAFIGVVIGLLIGEYTTSVKLWILAVTAGGFLYVGLVDMLPQMLKQCVEKDGFTRFVYQNVGFLLGLIIMLLIAWFEESFQLIFSTSH